MAQSKLPDGFRGWTLLGVDAGGTDQCTYKKATRYDVRTPDGRVGSLLPCGGKYKFIEQLQLFAPEPEEFSLTAQTFRPKPSAPMQPASRQPSLFGNPGRYGNPRILTGQVREMPTGGAGVLTYERHGGKREATWVPVPGGAPDWRQDLASPPRRLATPAGFRKSPLVRHSGKDALSTAYMPDGRPIDVAWQIVDLGQLIVSHNPFSLEVNRDFPQELQPRDRGRKSYQDQIARLVAGFNPDLLTWSATVSDGAPIVGPGAEPGTGVVESGNGRTMALSRVYKAGGPKADAYRDTVRTWAKELGISVPRVEHPVLVRVRQTDVDRAEFARGANVSTLQGMAAGEQAVADAAQMSAGLLAILEPTAGLATQENAGFVGSFIAQVAGRGARGQILDDRQRLSKTGEQRLDLALFAYAYGPEAQLLIAELAEVRESETRTVLSGMLDAAPYVARLRADIAQGLYPSSLDPSDSLAKTALFVRGAKIAGLRVSDRLKQADAFDAPTPAMLLWLQALHPKGERASAKHLSAVIVAYCALVRLYPEGQGDMFGPQTPSATSLIDRAIAEVRDR